MTNPVQQTSSQAPYSLEAEQALLGALLLEPRAFLSVASFLNNDDFFRAAVLKSRKDKIAELEAAKKERPALLKNQREAVQLIKKKGELTARTFNLFTVKEINCLLKWKNVKTKSKLKDDIVDALVDIVPTHLILTGVGCTALAFNFGELQPKAVGLFSTGAIVVKVFQNECARILRRSWWCYCAEPWGKVDQETGVVAHFRW